MSSGAAYRVRAKRHDVDPAGIPQSSNPGKEDWFGVRIAISGDGNTVAVSAPNEDSAAKGSQRQPG